MSFLKSSNGTTGLLLLMAAGALVAGINRFVLDHVTVPKYTPAAQNLVKLQNFGLDGSQIILGEFTMADADQAHVSCRLAPMDFPYRKPFNEYLADAVFQEMRLAKLVADKPDPERQVVITGHVERLILSSTTGYWDVKFTLKSSNGNTLTVLGSYPFDSLSLASRYVCHAAATTLMPAVQHLLNKAMSDTRFEKLL